MRYEVKVGKKALKGIGKMPRAQQDRFALLAEDLREKGPVQSRWPNYSKLSDTEYHCHLSHKWVACWRHEKRTILIEVYYAGSREDAPY